MSEKSKIVVGLITASVVVIALAALIFGSRTENRSLAMSVSSGTAAEDRATETGPQVGYLYLTGAVSQEGVYPFTEGARLFELIEEAGGFLPEADPSLVNLAETVRDGQHVRIPFQGESAEAYENAGAKLVDVNAAGKQELMSLPGIGESKAEAIITFRKKNGPFRSAEDLLQVPGIGESILERIRDLIKV